MKRSNAVSAQLFLTSLQPCNYWWKLYHLCRDTSHSNQHNLVCFPQRSLHDDNKANKVPPLCMFHAVAKDEVSAGRSALMNENRCLTCWLQTQKQNKSSNVSIAPKLSTRTPLQSWCCHGCHTASRSRGQIMLCLLRFRMTKGEHTSSSYAFAAPLTNTLWERAMACLQLHPGFFWHMWEHQQVNRAFHSLSSRRMCL